MASRRGYLTQAELIQYANIEILDSTEADDRISQAEEMIDTFVGHQEKAIYYPLHGRAVGGGASSITLEVNQQNMYEIDYFKYCEIEIIGGIGLGQIRTISANVKASGLVSVSVPWDTTPDATSMYKIYQLGKFPRECDSRFYSTSEPYQYIKSIPEAIRRATAAQVEYLISMGDDFFSSNKSGFTGESIGDYSYQKNSNVAGGISELIAPKAKALLKGIKNITGEIT